MKKKNVRGIADALRTSAVFASDLCMMVHERSLAIVFFFFFKSENTKSFSCIGMPHSCASLHSIDSFSFIQFKKIAYYRLSQADVLGSNNDCFKFSVQQLQRLSLLDLHCLKQQSKVAA